LTTEHGVSVMEIKIQQIDSRVAVEANGQRFPDVFDGYYLKNSNSGESELWLCIKGVTNVSELSARIIK
jgi:hypothetical protein